jgi:hypothetical protein
VLIFMLWSRSMRNHLKNSVEMAAGGPIFVWKNSFCWYEYVDVIQITSELHCLASIPSAIHGAIIWDSLFILTGIAVI